MPYDRNRTRGIPRSDKVLLQDLVTVAVQRQDSDSIQDAVRSVTEGERLLQRSTQPVQNLERFALGCKETVGYWCSQNRIG